ncbi:tectonin beta-propeller repeat-containing protein 1-like isoform X2 [Acanthaster planci]|uniref:Tectonin beta-propeller repeat-containing protein 1-like isoform X2 n=1 Tax=Acanthaster planci TaxID=133434 RepID=A0A8B7Z850_ACAPL|nr:tectonin beta-propeller repeat-containing protein 1-like isoform X2 [Acanthaster planci]
MVSQNYLWAVDNCGHIHTLSTTFQLWQRRSHASDGHLVEFKKVTASKHCAWALGCDQELYVFMYPSDVPIRCLEYTYENQRWNPVHGFSQKGLFPTDRDGWSDEKGVRSLPKPLDIQLPSKHWVWEYEWHVDESIKGKRTGKGGWQYAVNFNARENFTAEKHWNSCVRRRKWIRYRKFKATGVWAVIPSLFPDALEEPFHDIAIGGGELPGQPEGYLSVWTITALGKVYCRTEVNLKCPEGIDWKAIKTPEDKGLVHISVGPTGVVWGVTWDGLGIVRTGVSRDHPLGIGWQYVAPPEEAGLGQVAVGFNAVWAISRDNKVWFRQGFEALKALVDTDACKGTSWVEMVGQMAAISVGPNDQVWALGFVDRQIFFRAGVTQEELCGRTWKLIDVHERHRSSSGGSYMYEINSLHGSMSSLSLGSDNSPSWTGKESPINMDGDELQRTARSVTMPALALGTRPLKMGSEMISRNALGKIVRTIAIQTNEVLAPVTADLDREEKSEMKVDLHPMLVRAKWTSGSQSKDEDIVISRHVTQSNLEINKIGELNKRNSRGKLMSISECRNADRIESNPLGTMRTASSDPSLSSSAEDSGFSSDPSKAYCAPQGNGVTLSQLHKDYEKRELTRQDSYSSDYSDTVIDFVGSLDELHSPERLDTETNKATQTEVITEDLPATESLTSQESHSQSIEDLNNTVRLMRRNAYRSRSETCPMPAPVITIDDVDPTNNSLSTNKTLRSISLEQNGIPSQDSLSSDVSNEDHLTVSGMDTYLDSSLADLTSSGEGGCLLWVSVSGAGCIIDPVSPPKWFDQAVVSNASLRHRLMDGSWRWKILALLKSRREQETSAFSNIPLAVERTSWVKVGRMQWYSEGKRRQWIDCTVELQKGVDGIGLEEPTFTCHHNQYGKIKQIQFLLSEITCVLEVNNFDRPAFAIYTAKRVLERRPVKLRVGNDKELQEWVSALSLACCESRGINGPPLPNAAWCITCRGDIFVYDTLPNMETAPSSLMFWRQIGGHMAVIEACPAGVVWGLGMDNTPWVHTGGYGGGIFKGVYSGIGSQTDHKHVCIYEIQRWNPLLGFTDRVYPDAGWTDEAGKMECSKEAVNPPTRHWQWITEWRVDFTVPGSTDNEGWQYAKEIKSRKGYHKDKRWNDYARRRRWIRKCQLVTTGPWREIPNLTLSDVSMQPDVDEDWDGPIALWAIGSNGDVLTRLGVTRHCPEGYSWLHVPTDQSFQSISVGGNYRVWAVAKDGSAFFRNGIHGQNPTGDAWFHIALPAIAPLIQVSCGATAVWAVDSQMNLWFRENITPTFPEGTRWIHVSNKVRKVSVGPQDQIWIIADEVNGAKGVICRREGINPKKPTGTSWDKGAGGGIMHIVVRACSQRSTEVTAKIQQKLHVFVHLKR